MSVAVCLLNAPVYHLYKITCGMEDALIVGQQLTGSTCKFDEIQQDIKVLLFKLEQVTKANLV
jgi:hypothetical protein